MPRFVVLKLQEFVDGAWQDAGFGVFDTAATPWALLGVFDTFEAAQQDADELNADVAPADTKPDGPS